MNSVLTQLISGSVSRQLTAVEVRNSGTTTTNMRGGWARKCIGFPRQGLAPRGTGISLPMVGLFYHGGGLIRALFSGSIENVLARTSPLSFRIRRAFVATIRKHSWNPL